MGAFLWVDGRVQVQVLFRGTLRAHFVEIDGRLLGVLIRGCGIIMMLTT